MNPTIKDANISRSAVVFTFLEISRQSGRDLGTVNTAKQPCSPRCLFEYPDTPEIRELLEKYENRQILPLPAKSVNQAYSKLLTQARSLQIGRIGGAL